MSSLFTPNEVYIHSTDIVRVRQPSDETWSSARKPKEQVYNINISGAGSFQATDPLFSDNGVDGANGHHSHIYAFQDDQQTDNVTYEVDEICLMILFRFCFQCHKETKPSIHEKCGTRVTIRADCPDGHFVVWSSSRPSPQQRGQNDAGTSTVSGKRKRVGEDELAQRNKLPPNPSAGSASLPSEMPLDQQLLPPLVIDPACVKQEPPEESFDPAVEACIEAADVKFEYEQYSDDVPLGSDEAALRDFSMDSLSAVSGTDSGVQSFLIEVVEKSSGNTYKELHMEKECLAQQGLLPECLDCPVEVYHCANVVANKMGRQPASKRFDEIEELDHQFEAEFSHFPPFTLPQLPLQPLAVNVPANGSSNVASGSQKRKRKEKPLKSASIMSEAVSNGTLKVKGRLHVQVKLKIIEECLKSEQQHGKPKYSQISNRYGITRQATGQIFHQRHKILNFLEKNPFSKAQMISNKRDPVIEIMEDTLLYWINKMISNRTCLIRSLIQEKAREIVENYRKQLNMEGNIKFYASNGWYCKFRNRTGLQSISCTGKSVCVDKEVVDNFVENLKQLIREEEYHPKQVFNAEELGFIWKLMPSHTFAPGYVKFVPGSKVAKQRVTMLIGGNAYGDFPLTPLLIGHTKYPRAISDAGIKQRDLPLIYRWNERSAWMTTSLFREWFSDSFVPAVEQYLEKESLPKKALLLLDNAPVHPKDLGIDHPNIKVLFMPQNCSCLIQPMDQAAIKAFKSYYVQTTLKLCDKAFSDHNQVPKEFWRKFSILDCINQAAEAWKDIKPSTWRKSWKQIWPSIEEDCTRYENASAGKDCLPIGELDLLEEYHDEEFYKQNFSMVTDDVDYELLPFEQAMYITENMGNLDKIDGLNLLEESQPNCLDDSGAEQFRMQIAVKEEQLDSGNWDVNVPKSGLVTYSRLVTQQ